MSSAYICDKCGRPYPYENITTIKAYRYYGARRRLGGELRLINADLCPNCILKLDDWINSKGEAEDERKKWEDRIEQMKNEFIHIGEGSGWLDISLHHCLEIIDKYAKEQNNETNS